MQGDEAFFQGYRKGKAGRLRDGDKKREGDKEARDAVKENDGESSGSPCAFKETKISSSQGVDPWVFGLYMSPTRFRFLVVEDRSGDTIIPLIQDNVRQGSTVVTNGWAGYNKLTMNGFVHDVANHSQHFVNPHTGFHTQAIERESVCVARRQEIDKKSSSRWTIVTKSP